MTGSDRRTLAEIAHEYYSNGLTQAAIAEKFGISRPLVSRKLTEARDKGIVKIFIDDYEQEISAMEQQFLSIFNLKGIRIASVPTDDVALSVQITAQLGARYLSEFINDGDRLGLGWGWTLYEMSKAFKQQEFSVEMVCQLTGSVDNAHTRGYSNEIVGNFAKKLNAASAYTLPCPVMVDNVIISDTLRHDAKIRELLNRGSTCNKFLINIALPDKESCLYQAGYLDDTDLETLTNSGSVGSVNCRFFNEQGEVSDQDIDNRTMGISIEQIKNADCVLACITGKQKAEAVYIALKHGLINVLVIDSQTAEAILDLAGA